MDMPAVIRTLGRGKSGSRDLTFDEAYHAMSSILDGTIHDLQLGALLMLLRVKEESAIEISAMVTACHDALTVRDSITVDINWPAYAGKKKQPSWYLLAAKLLAQNGVTILMHGGGNHTANRQYAEDVCRYLNLPIANSLEQAEQHMIDSHFCYIPLRLINSKLSDLIDLKSVLGLRSPANTLVRHITPFKTRLTLQSMFHPAYQALHNDSASLLGQQNNIVLKGDSGEFEVRPDSETSIAMQGYLPIDSPHLSRTMNQRAIRPESPTLDALSRVWTGMETNIYAERAVIDTATVIYAKLKSIPLEEARLIIESWWQQRNA